MYKTTREFLIQFGLSSLAELPTLKEFEELGRLALSDSEEVTQHQATRNTVVLRSSRMQNRAQHSSDA